VPFDAFGPCFPRLVPSERDPDGVAGPPATRLVAGRYVAMAGRYAARGGPLRGYGGPLRGSRRAATRLWRAATRRPPNHDEASTRCRYAAQVYHTRPKLFYEAQILSYLMGLRSLNIAQSCWREVAPATQKDAPRVSASQARRHPLHAPYTPPTVS
jgi:hypothetical protein